MESEGQIYDWAIWAERYEKDPNAVRDSMARAFQNAMDKHNVHPVQVIQDGITFSTNPQRYRIWLVSVLMQSGKSDESFAKWWS